MNLLHRLDPPAQHHAATIAGQLAARGLVDGPELLGHIIAVARAAAPRCDPGGLQTRLTHRFTDSQEATLRVRARTRARIAWAIAPLLDRRAPGPALLAAAAEADPACHYTPHEHRALVEAAILRTLARHGPRSRR